MSDLDTLRRIALHTEKRVERWKTQRPVEALRESPLYGRAPRDFAAAFSGQGPRVIAEVKFASPSEGFLQPAEKANPQEAARVAGQYLKAGAAAVSILTERHFFAGAPEFLGEARRAHPEAPLLMKDFVIDEYQLELARAEGADCVLLIAALLGAALPLLHERARALGLSVLVEVHDEAELAEAMKARPAIVGVNSRNLKTLETDLGVARRLAGKGGRAVMIAESGLKTRADLDELGSLGYKGFLIGTSLMKTGDPGRALKELLA
jgi:indole-3-glycerol phosphate synthase